MLVVVGVETTADEAERALELLAQLAAAALAPSMQLSMAGATRAMSAFAAASSAPSPG